MAQEQRLVVLENTGDTTINDMWDSITYHFEAGEKKTLPMGIGLHFREKHPSLKVVEESFGVAPDAADTMVNLVNKDEKTLTFMWDGRPYTFEPGVPVSIASKLVAAFTSKARSEINPDFPKGGHLEVYTAPQEPVSAPQTPETPLDDPEVPFPAPKARKAKK